MISAVFGILSLASQPARAAGFEVAQQSAAAGGTGHASTARIDAAAGWFNPAALADGDGARLAVGAALASAAITAEIPGEVPQISRTISPLGTPPHAYGSVSKGVGPVNLLAGLAFNTAFASAIRWPNDSPLRFYSLESAPRFFRIAPYVGGGMGPVRLAAGLHVDAGGLYVHRATDHVEEEGSVQLSLRGAGVGPDLAAFVDLPKLDIGLSYKGRTVTALSGEADFDVPAAFQETVPDQSISARFRLPDRIALGAALDTGPLTVVSDVVYTAWSVNDVLNIDFSEPVTDDIAQVAAWRNTLALRSGIEAGLAKIVTLRAGGYLDGLPRPAGPPETLSPSSPDGVRLAATLGAGLGLGSYARVDAFGELLAILPRDSTSPDFPEARYRGRALVVGATAAAHF